VASLRTAARIGFEAVENWFDRAFGPQWNPLHQLGALGWFYFWIVCVSGVYLYIFFDTGIKQAYESLEYITNVQWYAGGVMRSLHRYASDALIIVMMLHLLREFVMDRYRGVRWFAWFTGVPLIWFALACGISGYWMVWDVLAQYIAITTTEWLDSLGVFGQSIARNFLNPETVSGRFFTLMVFIHIAVPLVMLLAMWIHIHRHNNARVNPPKGLAIGTMGMLLVLSFIKPAVSQPPADMSTVPAVINFDWFYLFAYPSVDILPGSTVWIIAGAATLLLLLMPWLPPQKRQAAALVHLESCNACGRCVDDCPYSAITLQPRSDGANFSREAVVDNDLCTSCGICVGSCPTATPFRRTKELIPGIELPHYSVESLRDHTLKAVEKLTGDTRVLVYSCDQGPNIDVLQKDDVAVLKIPCVAMLPPSFVDLVLTRDYVDGVFFTGCAGGDCHYRMGMEWEQQRMAGTRDPFLRKRVPHERVCHYWAGLTHNKQLKQELTEFQKKLKIFPPYKRHHRERRDDQSTREIDRRA